MTRKEALKKAINIAVCSKAHFKTKEARKEVENTIEALEQELKTDVLDRIRAEIEQNAYPIVHGVNNHEKGMTLYGILQVIDKYKAESEEV